MQNKEHKTESRECEPFQLYEKSSFINMHKILSSLHNDELFCDIKLITDDKKTIFAHKIVLASASPYFYAMFTNFEERNNNQVVLRKLDSTALQLLVQFIYSGKILVTRENVQNLLPAADLLQLDEVMNVCCDFLESQLCSTNCIGINAMANLYSCMKLLQSSELYILRNFSGIVDGEEFPYFLSEQLIKVISSEKLLVPSEEKVFESVIRWVQHELDSRKFILPALMEHVRLPLTSYNYLLKKIEEPLIKNCQESLNYIIEALNFHLCNSEGYIPQNIRQKPRHGDKVILYVGGFPKTLSKNTRWFDTRMEKWHCGPKMITRRYGAGVGVVKDTLVFRLGGCIDGIPIRSIDVLDLSSESPQWKNGVDMIHKRQFLRVAVINNNVYAIGGYNINAGLLKSVEVFYPDKQEWHVKSSMPTKKAGFGVGVLHNVLYVVGGCDQSSNTLDTVECYHSTSDTWTSVQNMSLSRVSVGVGVVDGILYAVGGSDGVNSLNSVEAYNPSTGIWTFIEDMHFPRKCAGVVALDGLLYVFGGYHSSSIYGDIESYNPKTDTWTVVSPTLNFPRTLPIIVAVNRPHNLQTY